MFTKEQLTPHAIELFRRIVAALPPEIGSRLRPSRRFYTHGNYRTLFLFDIWDCNQIFDRQHFKYSLSCDYRPAATRDGSFGLWLNRIRIYREREAIITTLDRELQRVVPPNFDYSVGDRAYNMRIGFTYPKILAELPDLLLPHCVNLISAVHPVLIPIIDQFTTPLESGERRAAVGKRGRLPFTPPGSMTASASANTHDQYLPVGVPLFSPIINTVVQTQSAVLICTRFPITWITLSRSPRVA